MSSNTSSTSRSVEAVVEGGRKVTQKEEIAEVLLKELSGNAKDTDGTSKRPEVWKGTCCPLRVSEASEANRYISWEEIRKATGCSGDSKATGDNGILNEVYEAVVIDWVCKTRLGKSIAWLFGEALESGRTPQMEGDRCSAHPQKKGDARKVDNYRGIALIDTLGKAFSKILAERVSEVAHELLVKEQCGVRKSEESVAHAAALTEMIQRRKLKNEETYLGFIDIGKGYDTVPHEALLEKLCGYGQGTYARVYQRTI